MAKGRASAAIAPQKNEFSDHFLDVVGKEFKFDHAKGVAEWIKNSADAYSTTAQVKDSEQHILLRFKQGKGPRFPRVLLSDQDVDPLDPAPSGPFHVDERQPPVYQRDVDLEQGIYWINTSSKPWRPLVSLQSPMRWPVRHSSVRIALSRHDTAVVIRCRRP